MTINTNILIITLDSCRWDTYEIANSQNIDKILNVRPAYTHGTYTLPAHLSIYSGILPNVKEKVPYYNRFCKQLIRIENRYTESKDALIVLPKDSLNIITGLKAYGYHTSGFGAVSWFKNNLLTQYFDNFIFTGIHLDNQIELFKNEVNNTVSPFFCLLNIGETHEPYKYGGLVKETYLSRARTKTFSHTGFLDEDFNSQIKAIEFIDRRFNNLISYLNNLTRKTIIVLTADHGECFGEDNLYGRGFYHEKIMEVPLGIGYSNGENID